MAFVVDWEQRFPANDPSDVHSYRAWYGLCYSPLYDIVLLFGGTDFSNDFNDTWIWDDDNWTQITPGTSPPARDSMQIAWDATNNVFVFFAGAATGTFPGTGMRDTWIFDPNTLDWTDVTPANPADSPPRRLGHGMAYHAGTGKVIMFGGQDTLADGVPFDDTWEWDGGALTWTQKSPAHVPTARGSFMGFSSAGDDVLLFGGNADPDGNFDASGALDDTWIWDGTDWIAQSPATSPPAILDPALGPSTGSGDLVYLFGGIMDFFGSVVYNTDTYGWDGSDWTLHAPTTVPPPEFSGRGWSSVLAGNPVGQTPSHPGVMFFNDLEGLPGDTTDETWTFPAQPPQSIGIRAVFGLGT